MNQYSEVGHKLMLALGYKEYGKHMSIDISAQLKLIRNDLKIAQSFKVEIGAIMLVRLDREYLVDCMYSCIISS